MHELETSPFRHPELAHPVRLLYRYDFASLFAGISLLDATYPVTRRAMQRTSIAILVLENEVEGSLVSQNVSGFGSYKWDLLSISPVGKCL